MVKRTNPFGSGNIFGSRPKNPFAPAKPRKAANPFAAPKAKAYVEPKPRNHANETTICQAIRQRALVGFRYRATDAHERLVQPHVLWETEAGGACLFGLQIQSETGARESSPQHFDPYKMTGLRVIAEDWRPDPSFKRDAYKNVICMVG